MLFALSKIVDTAFNHYFYKTVEEEVSSMFSPFLSLDTLS